MATFNVIGLDEARKQFLHASEVAIKAVPVMLKQGSDVVIAAQKREIQSMKLEDTGAMIKSIKASKVKLTPTDSIIIVRPYGKDKKGVRNAQKGFVAEYGKTNQVARPWMSVANAKCEQEVVNKMGKVWEDMNGG